MFDNYINAFKRWSDFDGRASLAEYWNFILINLLVSALLNLAGGQHMGGTSYLQLSFLYAIIAFVPGISVSVRRMHDIGKSGAYVLWNIIPIIGWFIFLYFAIQPSVEKENDHDHADARDADQENMTN